MSVLTALEASLEAAPPAARDAAAVELARTLAELVDARGDDVGPHAAKLLTVLDALHLTPRSRARLNGGKDDPPEADPLDELKERRRKRRAQAVDQAAP